jgi:hypothetical protein
MVRETGRLAKDGNLMPEKTSVPGEPEKLDALVI